MRANEKMLLVFKHKINHQIIHQIQSVQCIIAGVAISVFSGSMVIPTTANLSSSAQTPPPKLSRTAQLTSGSRLSSVGLESPVGEGPPTSPSLPGAVSTFLEDFFLRKETL